MDDTPSWGIEPVPERLRVLGTLDSFLLWTNLGISLLVLVASAYLELSLRQALLATVIGWSRWLGGLHPPHGGIGASLPSFGVAFVVAFVVARVGSGVDATARRNRASLA